MRGTKYQNSDRHNTEYRISEYYYRTENTEYQNTNDSLQNREYSTQNIRIQDVRMWDPKYQNSDRFNTATTKKQNAVNKHRQTLPGLNTART